VTSSGASVVAGGSGSAPADGAAVTGGSTAAAGAGGGAAGIGGRAAGGTGPGRCGAGGPNGRAEPVRIEAWDGISDMPGRDGSGRGATGRGGLGAPIRIGACGSRGQALGVA